MLKKLTNEDVNRILSITHDEKEIMKFTEFVLPRITEMVKINGEAAAAELGLGFDITNPEVIKWIKKHTGESRLLLPNWVWVLILLIQKLLSG